MRIVVTNDDGIYSPGLRVLAEVASILGDVRIVAPDVEQSSMGHAITHARPLTYRKTSIEGFEAYRVNGTPADCVALGCHHWDRVDVVLSGINLGLNVGNSAWHSGTLAAAKQAALLGIRGIAVSAPFEDSQPAYDTIKPYLARLLPRLLSERDLALLNVNFPLGQPKGVVWTRQSVRQYDGQVVPGKDPMGRTHFWITVVPIEAPDEGTDRWAVEQGLVSVTPLRLDITNVDALQDVEKRIPLSLGELDMLGGPGSSAVDLG